MSSNKNTKSANTHITKILARSLLAADIDIGPSLSRKQNFINNKEYYNLLRLVQKRYPMTFPTVNMELQLKILAIGMHIELAQRLNLSKTLVRKFLSKYCRTKLYKQAQQIGAPRYDLDGNVVGVVTEEQIDKKANNK